ncbi:hypothetical protein CC86DRAFT_399688 [Ophiobolus disseminans]|uniref:Uncharacterized protein n=1 Tax=Ophiobolus disseminans TaxID=1469910 RepID=A0A6A7AIU6_9PLEO|nr:hypothetical protein CC86DRAFT_399688 [Ophiobolus disseminans]
MESYTNSFGRSTSMPVLQQQDADQEDRGRAQFGFSRQTDTFDILEASNNFRQQNAKIWSPNGLSNGFLSSPAPRNGFQNGQVGDSSDSPTPSKPTGRPLDDVKDTSPTTQADSGQPKSEAEAADQRKKEMMEILADSPVFRPQGQPNLYTFASPFSAQPGTPQGPKSPFWRSALGTNGNGASEMNGHSYTSSEDSLVICGEKKDLSKQRLPGLGHSSPVTDNSPPKELNHPSGFLHHRRNSSRVSSMPNIPSPLGPRHYTDDLGSDVSGLVSPLPNAPATNGQRREMDTQDGAQIFGIHTRQPMTNGRGNPFLTQGAFGFGHLRRDTDPFVEPTDKWSQPLKASPFVTQATQRSMSPTSPETLEPLTPLFNNDSFMSLLGSPPMHWSPMTPEREQANIRAPTFNPYQSGVPRTPSFLGFNGNNPSAPRVDLPIPPPPLPAAQAHLQNSPITPQSRARLDAHAGVRGDWIRTEAHKITELSRMSFAAAQHFQQTKLMEDYHAWQRLAAELDRATNLEKRQEQRRNMFMPNGVKAMKTGAGNLVSDQSAAYAAAHEANCIAAASEQEEGKLLGFQMAYMERVCAEVKRRADEKEDKQGEISLEMLETLSIEEKKALREHLVARLQSASAGNKAGVLSESFV